MAVKDLNLAKQRVFERLIGDLGEDECGAFLVWGDPALYDSTIRILEAILRDGRHAFEYEVIPGISSVQALAARHKVPLNRIGGTIEITTGRRLAEGFPAHADSVVVMLDAEDTYRRLNAPDLDIYWGPTSARRTRYWWPASSRTWPRTSPGCARRRVRPTAGSWTPTCCGAGAKAMREAPFARPYTYCAAA